MEEGSTVCLDYYLGSSEKKKLPKVTTYKLANKAAPI